MEITHNPMRCPICPKCEQDRMYWRTDNLAWVCSGGNCDGYCTKEEFQRGLEEHQQQREILNEKVNQAMSEGRHDDAVAIAMIEPFMMKPNTFDARNGTRNRYGNSETKEVTIE